MSSFAEVNIHFKPALKLGDRTMDYMSVPEGGSRTFAFEGSPEAYDLAVEFARRIDEQSGGRLVANFNPLHRMVTVTAPEPGPESEIHVDPPTERDSDELMGVRALWSALKNNGRRGSVVINSSTADSANLLVDWGLAVVSGVNKLSRSELASELIDLIERSCTFDDSRCICTNGNNVWHCNPKCLHCHPEG